MSIRTRIAARVVARLAAQVTFTGPHDGIEAGLATSGKDPVVFYAEVPNPKYDPDDFYMIRGKKHWWEKPTKKVAWLLIDLSHDGDAYSVNQAWTNDGFRRQGLVRHLYEMAWDYTKRKRKGFQSGWVQSPLMAHYWSDLELKGKAESYEDQWTKFNTGGKGWRRVKGDSRP